MDDIKEEMKGTIIKDSKGKLFFVVGSKKTKCEGKTELRQEVSNFIRGL